MPVEMLTVRTKLSDCDQKYRNSVKPEPPTRTDVRLGALVPCCSGLLTCLPQIISFSNGRERGALKLPLSFQFSFM